MPLRRVRHSSVASAVSSSPSRAPARKSIDAPAATVESLCELQAKAKALSPRAKTIPPWQRPWPFTMSARTRITTCAHPGRTPARRMPSACEARSRSYSAAAARSARCWAVSSAGWPATLMAYSSVSSTGEARCALLGEGGHPFGIVGAAAELALVVTLDVELLPQGPAETFVNRLLGARESTRGGRGKLQCEAVHQRGKLRVLDASPDHAPACSLLGGELLPEKRETQSARGAYQARQEPGAARIGHEAELRERLHEARRARCHHEITGERNVGAGAGGHAVHRGDHRQRQLAKRQHQRLVVLLDRVREVGRAAIRGDRAVGKILPGTEAAPCAGDHQHPRRRAMQRRECGANFRVHRSVEAVQPLRAIEGQPGDTAAEVEDNVLVAHLHGSVRERDASGRLGSGFTSRRSRARARRSSRATDTRAHSPARAPNPPAHSSAPSPPRRGSPWSGRWSKRPRGRRRAARSRRARP